MFAIGGNGPIYGRKLTNKQVLVLRYTPDNKGGYGEHFEVVFTGFFLGRGRKQNPPPPFRPTETSAESACGEIDSNVSRQSAMGPV